MSRIYLYGERHGFPKIYEKELSLWNDYYRKENMRHLFIESSYYQAEFLNIWIKSDNDELLDVIFADLAGTPAANIHKKAFYKKIKDECHETIFHGADVGHQHTTTGARFLEYLKNNGEINSERYSLALKAIEQGKLYYGDRDKKEDRDYVYRENTLAENFTREFDKLNGEKIMGIFGAAHTALDGLECVTRRAPCMANRLFQRYGDIIYSEDLSPIARDIEPIGTEIIAVNGKEYRALYFGE